MKIDFHVHLFPDEVARKAIPELARRAGRGPYTDGTLSGTTRKFKESKVDGFVVLSIATNPKQQKNVNDFAIKLKNEGLTAFGSVHPEAPDKLEELHRIRAAGLSGLKLHPVYQNFVINDRSMYPVYDYCEAAGLPICFHAGVDVGFPDDRSAFPEFYADIIRDFPGLKVIFAHLGGYKAWDDVYSFIAGKGREVYFDTAAINWTIDRDFAVRIIEKHGADRILMGSDCPWDDPKNAADFIDSLKLSDGKKDMIFSLNAKRLLKI
ncbi:MAG: amidohydrolase family protein [Bacillota bacterium]|nr:amidohydrolase family protein [Bacillota bacterium]